MILALLLAASASPAPAACAPQRIQRVPPSEAAAEAGLAVAWRDSLSGALEESRTSGKPVFWYVTSTHRSFMDRAPEVDRLMMAGPFSWPRTVELLNNEFIPVRGRAGEQTGEKYGLVRVDFIEPGWVVLDGEGIALASRDRINTLHPARFGAPLAEIVGADWDQSDPYPGIALDVDRQLDFHLRFQRADDARSPLAALAHLPESAMRAEALYLHGCGLHDARQEEAARDAWRLVAEFAPGHPLAAAAAMEAEGHGPYARGLASFELLPLDVYADSGAGSQAPDGALVEDEVWAMATRFLQRMQRAEGGWEDSIYDFGGTDSLPNVYVATSALCMQAMLEAGARDSGDSEDLAETLRIGHRYALDDAFINLEDRDERVWVYLYRMQYLARRMQDEVPPMVLEHLRGEFGRNCDALLAMQKDDGSWYHEYSNPFVTASALLALHSAQELGYQPDGLEEAVKIGIEMLRKCRTEDVAYTYGIPRGTARAAVAASVGRAPLGELALQLWGATDADLAGAVERSFRDEEPLFLARKYDDHTDMHAYGGFFFWYDMHVRTLAIAALEDDEAQRHWAQQQKARVLSLVEFDGAFIDSHELGRSYGTAMALICLAELDRVLQG